MSTSDEPDQPDREDVLMKALADASFKCMRGEDPALTATHPEQPFVPLDPQTDQQEFAELIAFISANKDAGTLFEHVPAEEFANGLEEPGAIVIPEENRQ